MESNFFLFCFGPLPYGGPKSNTGLKQYQNPYHFYFSGLRVICKSLQECDQFKFESDISHIKKKIMWSAMLGSN